MLTNYGLLTGADAGLIAGALDLVVEQFPSPVIVEIGIWDGATSRAIASHVAGRVDYSYWAVDSGKDQPAQPPFPGANMVVGDSIEVYDRVPPRIHFLLIDGCHCVNHAILDFMHYGARVVHGGLVVLHDSGVEMQGKDYQGHGPQAPDFHVAVRRAVDMMGLDADPRWIKTDESDTENWGGAIAYQRTAQT